MQSPPGSARHSPGDAAPDKAASHATGRDSSHTSTRRPRSGGDEGRAAGVSGPVPAGPQLDERVLKLIRRYATPDRGGWVMPPADMWYRLRNWHGVQITREQLAEVLRAAGSAPAMNDRSRV